MPARDIPTFTTDCYAGAPTDRSVWQAGDCGGRVLRGGSRLDVPWALRSANRNWYTAVSRVSYLGFRVARTLN